MNDLKYNFHDAYQDIFYSIQPFNELCIFNGLQWWWLWSLTNTWNTANKILASNEFESDSVVGIWKKTIVLDSSALLTINASAAAGYTGSPRNAGIRLVIRLDDDELASDFTFEGTSANITFYASTSATLFVEPGSYNLRIERENGAVNRDFFLRANYVAIFAEKWNSAAIKANQYISIRF